MTTRIIRFRVYEGRLVPLEPVSLVEGAEVEVLVPVADTVAPAGAKPTVRFRSWKMGVKEPLTREEIYEDIV